MRYVDAHVHLDVRSYENIEKMALSGVRTVITCSHDPYPDMTAEVYSALFRRLLKVETWRGRKAGLTVRVAVGVHPGGVPDNVSDVLREIEDLLSYDDVVAIGETGLNENPDDRDPSLKGPAGVSPRIRGTHHCPHAEQEQGWNHREGVGYLEFLGYRSITGVSGPRLGGGPSS
ncbi:TatD family hydrolase [Methanopyrus sp. SNP6]|uniref:TatD family hydrolase n=1 Tax=Methanopyrus sp. SNP6 TaxID=1937005 RepID=UPI0011E5DA13|nr:TatD family hydrolase [Methanopyrus sp. SNP6]